MTSKYVQWGAVALVMIAACALMLFQLGAAPLQDYDEATYAQVTHEMLASGDFVYLTHTGENYFEKPPLYFWMASASVSIFGESEFALRLPSALTGIALVALVMLFVYEVNGSMASAVLAGAILTTISPFVETARQVRIDVPMALWITLAAYAFVRGLKHPKWFLLFGVAAGLAVLTKSVIAAFAFAAVIIFSLCFRRFSWLREKYFWWGILLFLCIALPWHIAETLRFGAVFWREYIGFDVVTRSAQDIFAVHNTNAEYVSYLAEFALPWTQLFVFGFVFSLIYQRSLTSRMRAGAWAAAAMVALVLMVFFIAATKAPTYLVPLYPFAAIFIALISAPFLSKKFGVAALALLLLLGLGSTIYSGFHFNPYYAQTDELAREEKAVGQLITQNAPQGTLYAFEDTNLGSIMFYSGDTHPSALTGSNVPAGSVIVLPSSATSSLVELYPALSVETLYSGSQISLFRAQ